MAAKKKKTAPKTAPAKKKAKAAPAKKKTAPAKKKTAKASAKKAPAKKKAAGLARQTLEAHAMKKAIEQVFSPPPPDASAVVDAYMNDVDHPFKAEMQAVRDIILGASPKIAERIKWNAPSFYYKEDLAAFNPRESGFAHLILLFPGGAGVPAKSPLLEGKAKDRREAKFHGLSDVANKKRALEKLVKEWVKLRDA